jgi:hypothetical protein
MQSLQSNERVAFYKIQMFTTELKIPRLVFVRPGWRRWRAFRFLLK